MPVRRIDWELDGVEQQNSSTKTGEGQEIDEALKVFFFYLWGGGDLGL